MGVSGLTGCGCHCGCVWVNWVWMWISWCGCHCGLTGCDVIVDEVGRGLLRSEGSGHCNPVNELTQGGFHTGDVMRYLRISMLKNRVIISNLHYITLPV